MFVPEFVNVHVTVAGGKQGPREQSSWGQRGAHLGPVGPMWAPCWPHEPRYQVPQQNNDSLKLSAGRPPIDRADLEWGLIC